MAIVTVKVFGVFRSDTRMSSEVLPLKSVADVFPVLNVKMNEVYSENRSKNPDTVKPADIKFRDAVIYVNGEKVSRKSQKLSDGDEVWVMSPASGG